MTTQTRAAHRELIDVSRMHDAAMTAGESAQALFGYLSRLDALRDADLDQQALAERAAEAEVRTRVMLSASMDALNELHDLGLLDRTPTAKEVESFNQVRLSEAVGEIADAFADQMPTRDWGWLRDAGELVRDVELRVRVRKGIVHGTVTHGGQSTAVRLDAKAPTTRVSTSAFFSDGPDRVYAPTSTALLGGDEDAGPVAGYDASVGAMAFLREWVYRHARNAAELGPPVRSGGGPAGVVIVIVLIVVAAVATIAAAVLEIVCAAGSDKACRLAAYFGLAAKVLNGSAHAVDANNGQQQVLSYGTNPQ